MIHRFNIEAFPLTKETEAAAEGLRSEREFAKAKLNVMFGGLPRAIKHYRDHPSPRVMIVEDPSPIEQLLKNLEGLAEVVEPGRKVIVIGSINDVQVYRRLVSQGVTEYIVAPVTTQQLVEFIAEAVGDPAAKAGGRLIACMGARGGVGSTTVACNLAQSLGELTKEAVVLLDMDLNFGSVALAMNLDPKQSLGEALVDFSRLDSVLLERIMVEHDDYLSVLSTQGNVKDTFQPSVEAIEKLIDLARQMASYVVVDLPRQWADWVAGVLVMADEVVITAGPDLTNLRDCKIMIDWMRSRRGEQANLRLIINKLDASKKTQISLKDLAVSMKLAPTATLAFEPALFGKLSNDGLVFGEGAKSHKYAGVFRQLALITGGKQSTAARAKKPLLSWLKKR